jgi:hypothetical protein
MNGDLRRQRERRQKARLHGFVDELEAKSCADCGLSYKPWCMEFDHLSEKTSSIASLVERKASRARILAKVQKTEVVCVLCHRLRPKERRATNPFRRCSRKEGMVRMLVARAKCRPYEECGARRFPCQMDFDHTDPSKKPFGPADAPRLPRSLDEIRAELSKCRIVCALYHRRTTVRGVYRARFLEARHRSGIKVTSVVCERVIALKAQSLPQKVIAEAVGLSQGTVSSIVRGKYRAPVLTP